MSVMGMLHNDLPRGSFKSSLALLFFAFLFPQ
jgi:hypothetical protein